MQAGYGWIDGPSVVAPPKCEGMHCANAKDIM